MWTDLDWSFIALSSPKYYSRGHTTEKRTYTKQKCPDTNKRQIIIINTRLTEPTRSVPFTIPSSCFTLRLHLLPGTLQNNLHQTSYLSFKFKWGSHKKVQVTDSFCWYNMLSQFSLFQSSELLTRDVSYCGRWSVHEATVQKSSEWAFHFYIVKTNT